MAPQPTRAAETRRVVPTAGPRRLPAAARVRGASGGWARARAAVRKALAPWERQPEPSAARPASERSWAPGTPKRAAAPPTARAPEPPRSTPIEMRQGLEVWSWAISLRSVVPVLRGNGRVHRTRRGPPTHPSGELVSRRTVTVRHVIINKTSPITDEPVLASTIACPPGRTDGTHTLTPLVGLDGERRVGSPACGRRRRGRSAPWTM
jgi:hypothetical protein